MSEIKPVYQAVLEEGLKACEELFERDYFGNHNVKIEDFDPTRELFAKAAADYEALQKENAELKGEVKEWLCLDCNTVFPSESVPNSFSCLICPKCDGKRLPKNTAIIKVLREESAAQAKRIAELEKPQKQKMAPVQGYVQGIPWDMHLEAYNVYCKRYGAQQSLIEGGCRGGFGVGELDMFIPGWREKLSLVGKLNAEIESLRKQVEELLGASRMAITALAHTSQKNELYDEAYERLDSAISFVSASKNGE